MTAKRKRLVLCLDGTWNNPYQAKKRDDGSKVLKPSNPLKLSRAVDPWDPHAQMAQVTYYDTGVGALGNYPGISNKIIGFVDSKMGGAFGAGFEANIEQAVTFLVDNYLEGDQVYIFGFSRGAAQARGLSRFLDWMGGLLSKVDAFFVPLYFRHYLSTSGKGDPKEVKTASGHTPDNPLVPITIEFLGVWDTVMALGSRFRVQKGTSVVNRSFHVGEKPARCINHARQALAVDEQRYDFRPEVWHGHHPHQTLEQRWFPGVHSNIGGGYVNDGLANISFHWLLDEAESFGLVTDHEFTKHYRPYPQAQLYQSKTILYRALELVRFRRGEGTRKLFEFADEARLTLDKSVIHRMSSAPEEHKQLDLYRPANVIEFLTKQPDLATYLVSLGLEPGDSMLLRDILNS